MYTYPQNAAAKQIGNLQETSLKFQDDFQLFEAFEIPENCLLN
jgi:hypothetical protein